LNAFWGLSKDRDVVDETYVTKVSGILLANLQTMAESVILPSCHEQPQQGVDKDHF